MADRAQALPEAPISMRNSMRTAGMVALAGLAIGYTISVLSRQDTKRRVVAEDRSGFAAEPDGTTAGSI